jgi:hypothetical protein
MMSNPYQVLGTEPVIFRGRKKLFEQLTRQITKPTPDHVQVVGRKFVGKTVFLKHLAFTYQGGQQPYTTAFYWDLGHLTPTTDNEFLYRFSAEIRSVLLPVRPDLANELDPNLGDLWDILPEVLELLEDEDQKVLAVLDGFDRVLGMTGITRNLWDYLRSLAEKKSLTLVTGSRRPLRELCKTEESQTSDFWNIFNPTPLRVTPFDDDDWSEMLTPLREKGIVFDSSGPKELINWSGGVPILGAAICNYLFALSESGATISKEQVDGVANKVFEEYQIILDELWDGCSVEVQSDLIELIEKDLPLSQIPNPRCEILQECGYAYTSSRQIKASCRLMQKYARRQGSQVTDLRRLFGTLNEYGRNVRSLLELRLAQIPNGDKDLQRLIGRTIADLHPEPTDAVMSFRPIADKAIDLILNAEVPNRKIPQNWIEQWQRDNEQLVKDGNLPHKRGSLCGLLRVMTGTGNTKAVAHYISKPTALLVGHIQAVGDFGQHTEGHKVSLETAIAFCLSAIELCENLARELP